MQDILKQTISIGDTVTYSYYESNGAVLQVGIVKDLEKGIVVIQALNNKSTLIKKVLPSNVLVIVPSVTQAIDASLFKSKRVVLTGRIPGYSRDQAIERLRNWGAVISDTVSTSDIVLVMDDAIQKQTSKYQNATRAKKKIVGQKEFVALLGK